ncbi:MAG: hypothetical protein WAO19_08170 [Candidatus Kryptoniota bacterium]
MGINCYLEDERGKKLDGILDEKMILPKLIPYFDPAFPLIRYIDLYGNTVFNQVQLPEVISELRKLSENIQIDEHRQFLDRIIEFISDAQNRVHLYIKFYGD